MTSTPPTISPGQAISDLGKGIVNEFVSQGKQIAQNVVEGATGSNSSQQSSQQQAIPQPSIAQQIMASDKEKTDPEIAAIREQIEGFKSNNQKKKPAGPVRDLEQEMEKIRKEKETAEREKDKQEFEEKQAKLNEEQRNKQVQANAMASSSKPRPKRGSALMPGAQGKIDNKGGVD